MTSADTILWTLTKNGHRLEAVQRVVPDLGLEPRFSIDGELFYSQMYRNAGQLLAAAREKRADAEAKGLDASGRDRHAQSEVGRRRAVPEVRRDGGS